MWEKIQALLETHPERLRVARFLLQNGFSVRGDKIFVNQIEIATQRIARAVGVDRRTVNETTYAVGSDEKIREIFSKLETTGPSIRRAAKQMGLGTVEITAEDPNKIGILADASKILADNGISIRQALVDDPELTPEAKLTLIGSKPIPGRAIPLILAIPGVARVSVTSNHNPDCY